MATNLTRSGYLATAQSITWASGQTLLSLVNDEYTDLSDEIDNSTNKYMYADLELVLASAGFNGADAGIEVYLIPSLDGTNYPNWTGNVATLEVENGIYFEGFVPINPATAAQRLLLRDIELPNGRYKWAFRNRGNVTLAASGNTAAWRPHSVTA